MTSGNFMHKLYIAKIYSDVAIFAADIMGLSSFTFKQQAPEDATYCKIVS